MYKSEYYKLTMLDEAYPFAVVCNSSPTSKQNKQMKHTKPHPILPLPLPRLPLSHPLVSHANILHTFLFSVQWKAKRKFSQLSRKFFPCAKTARLNIPHFVCQQEPKKRIKNSGMHKVIVHGVFIRLLLSILYNMHTAIRTHLIP